MYFLSYHKQQDGNPALLTLYFVNLPAYKHNTSTYSRAYAGSTLASIKVQPWQ